MKTELLKASEENIKKASEILKKDEVVAFPTETVYGLGANALKKEAVSKIFKAKERPSDNPLIVHISDEDMLSDLVEEIPDAAEKLKILWPGPLTLVMKKKPTIPDITSAGLKTVGIRMPSHPVFSLLVKECGFPIAAPSANTFGKPSPTTAEHVKENMDGKIPLILDGGQCDVGIESTILDVSRDVPMLLRPGKISIEEIEAIIGTIEIHPSVTDPKQNQEIALSPGMKYRHYSPDAEVILITDNSKTKDIISECGNKKIGLITNDQNHALLVMDTFLYSKDLMSDLYYFLIELDKTVDVILIEGVDEKEVALMNRIKKAASRIV